MHLRKCLVMFTRFVGKGSIGHFGSRACWIHWCKGCCGGKLSILVTDLRIFSQRRSRGERKFVSFCSASVDVVRKHR